MHKNLPRRHGGPSRCCAAQRNPAKVLRKAHRAHTRRGVATSRTSRTPSPSRELPCCRALRSPRSIWGEDYRGETRPPSSGTYSAVATRDGISCALTPEAELACWGGLADDAPTGEFTAVAAGDRAACAIATNQLVECWSNGELDQSAFVDDEYTPSRPATDSYAVLPEVGTHAAGGRTRV
jgi:hypothetical protein